MVHRNEYRKRMAAISNYMQKFRVPSMVQVILVMMVVMMMMMMMMVMTQERVKLWLQYTWEHQKIFNESEVLAFLPPKMRTDLALKVHYATLSKVKLFQDCDTGADIVTVLCRNTLLTHAGLAGLLKELVTKLRPMVFLPGDYICRQD